MDLSEDLVKTLMQKLYCVADQIKTSYTICYAVTIVTSDWNFLWGQSQKSRVKSTFWFGKNQIILFFEIECIATLFLILQ